MNENHKLRGKTVFVTGGSGGLGKELSKIVAAQGAHVTILARQQGPLDEARTEILAARTHPDQEVNAVSVDLSSSSAVDAILKSQSRLPDILYCAAGGCRTECGFFADIEAADLESCMRNNYFTSAYIAQNTFKLWIEDDKRNETAKHRHRQIVFINSAAAFLGVPGYTAYTPSKCAVRGLADTLRMEALRYSGSASTYRIHCAFPSNFITDAFFEEQGPKPDLTKRIEGTEGSMEDLKKKYPSAEKVARNILDGVSKGDFAICDSFESALLWSNAIGPSPKRGLGIFDTLLMTIISFVVWPILRRQWDSMCRRDGNTISSKK